LHPGARFRVDSPNLIGHIRVVPISHGACRAVSLIPFLLSTLILAAGACAHTPPQPAPATSPAKPASLKASEPKVTSPPASRWAGWAQATDPLKKGSRDVLHPAGALKCMSRAYEMAGLKPADVNVAEVHDCFTVMGAIGTEVIGKAKPGEGARYWVEGKAGVKGECAINTSGGLIAKGHPIGATGVMRMVTLAHEMARRNVKYGLLTICGGGGLGIACVVARK